MKRSPTFASGVDPGTMSSSSWMRSGLKSAGPMTMPFRAVLMPAPAPSFASTQTSPKPFVGPTTMGSSTRRSIASRLSQKSIPSVVASNEPLVSTSPEASSSITAVGGTRPAAPMTVSAISDPGPPGVTVGEVISVVVRFALVAPPGRNSVTRPVTVTACPTETDAPMPVPKTRIASEVATLASPFASCIVKLFGRTDVTTPGTPDTTFPTSGDTCAAPWIWEIWAAVPTVVKVTTRFAVMVSGGSLVSVSATPWAKTVRVHRSPTPKSVSGSSV